MSLVARTTSNATMRTNDEEHINVLIFHPQWRFTNLGHQAPCASTSPALTQLGSHDFEHAYSFLSGELLCSLQWDILLLIQFLMSSP